MTRYEKDAGTVDHPMVTWRLERRKRIGKRVLDPHQLGTYTATTPARAIVAFFRDLGYEYDHIHVGDNDAIVVADKYEDVLNYDDIVLSVCGGVKGECTRAN